LVVSPRARKESVHPRLQSSACARPLNFTVRGRVSEPFYQSLSGVTSRIVGALTLLIGLGALAALFVNLYYFGRFILGADAEHAFDAFNLAVFAIFSPVLCVAGYRLLTGRSRHVGAVLPRAFWLTIGVIFILGAIFVAAIALYTGVFVRLLLFSALMVGGLGVQSIRVSMRQTVAPSNNRWRGP
jgi:hypothetical protein